MQELKAGFFNSVLVDDVPDRVYNSEDVNEHLKGLVSDDGIYANVSTACQVVQGTGMQVIVKQGRGKINNHWFEIEADTILDITAADVILNRIDSIVVRYSSTDRNIVLDIIEGALATTPVAPTLTRTSEIYEICLANILVNKNVTSITPSLITDTRPNNAVCGWITGLIEQMDTTTLYTQYEDAQNNFINEQQGAFYNWFETIKDEVASTSLYREYQEAYRSIESNLQTIPIPEEINYKNNGLDVLNVYINGNFIAKNIDYTISLDGTSIVLVNPLDLPYQDIVFVNKKSVSGTVAEDVIVQVEELQEKVNDLSNIEYVATGSDDNITISNIVKNFLDGTGDYSSVSDNANMVLNVVGTLGIGDLIEDQMVFDFHNTIASNRKITINFGNATIPSPTSPSTKISLLALFGMNEQVYIENANIKLEDYNATTIYGLHGGNIRNSKMLINNTKSTTIYGTWNTKEVSYNHINIVSSTSNQYGIYVPERALYNNVNITNGWPIATQQNGNNILIGNIVNSDNITYSDTIDIGNVNIGAAG